MTEQSGGGAASPGDAKPAEVGVWPLSAMMARALLASPQLKVLSMLAAATLFVVGATAFGQIQLNAWNKPFYDALAKKDFSGFLEQLLVFLVIAAGLLSLNVAQTWLNQMIKLKLREGLLGDLLNQWLEPGRAFRLAEEGEIGVNPDQRIHQDGQHLTELSTDLGIGLLQASLLLISFVGVLWLLSATVIFRFHGAAFTIPGYMVWCALLYAAIGSGLSWRVGRPLIPLNAERYAREADLRFALVRVNEHTDSIALYGGEADEKRHLGRDVDRVLEVMRRLVSGLTRLTWVTAGYGWLAIVAPILAASPGYFGGDLTLGGLMVAAGAFNQVQQSLRWFVDNFNTIADWLATLRRVESFRLALVAMGEEAEEAGRIERHAANDAKMTFDNLRIVSPTASGALAETHVEIGAGERVCIIGASKVGLTILFRAVAGLWSQGGRSNRPAGGGGRDVPATTPLHATGLPQRHVELSLGGGPVRGRRPGRRMQKRRSGPSCVAARSQRELGQRVDERRGAAPRVRQARAPQAALGLRRPGPGRAERSRSKEDPGDIRGRARRRGRHQFRRHRHLSGFLDPHASPGGRAGDAGVTDHASSRVGTPSAGPASASRWSSVCTVAPRSDAIARCSASPARRPSVC